MPETAVIDESTETPAPDEESAPELTDDVIEETSAYEVMLLQGRVY
jgi:hypothetical protein